MAEKEGKVLVTGAFGQIGSELVPALQKKHGVDNVVAMGHSNIPEDFEGIKEKADIRDIQALIDIVEKYDIRTMYHLVSILSAVGEKKPKLAWDVNINGELNVLEIAKDKNIKLFSPSSIAVFGPTTPRESTPQEPTLRPSTVYGISKNTGELWHQYYFDHGVDVRSLRYPGLISWKTPPGGGTTDYAVAVFYEGLEKGEYEFFVGPDTVLPMMYMDDAVRATIEIMDAEPEKIRVRTSYNLTAISFRAEDLAKELKKHIPHLKVSYKPDERQAIADSWPDSIDDSQAREDWGWEPEFDLPKMTEEMVKKLKRKLEVDLDLP